MALVAEYTRAYFIVTPDPTVSGNFAVREGVPGFFVKFGDGSPERPISNLQSVVPVRLRKKNYVISTHCPPERLLNFYSPYNLQYGPDVRERKTTRGEICKAGKFLEHRYLHITAYESGNTEWYWLGLNNTQNDPSVTVEALRQILCVVLEQFPLHHQWDYSVFGFGDSTPMGEIWKELNDSRKYQISPATPNAEPEQGQGQGDRVGMVYSDSEQAEDQFPPMSGFKYEFPLSGHMHQ